MNCGFCTYNYNEKENNQFYILRDCNNNLDFQFPYADNCMLCNIEMDACKARLQSPPA